MTTNWKNTHCCNQLWRAVAALALSVVVAFNASAQTQTQRKPKGPPPPSYDEVLQRAQSQKKVATNASTGNLQTSTIATPVTVPASESQTPPAPLTAETGNETPQSSTELPLTVTPSTLKTDDTAANASVLTQPSASLTQVAPAVTNTAIPSSPIPVPAALPQTAKPGELKPKGPVFSPLPPDLALTNQAPKGKSASAGSVSPDSSEMMGTLDDKHLLAIGDRLSFRIVEDEENPKELEVTDSGELEVPYLGRFYAVGKSCRQLAGALKAELEKDYYYQATVIVAVDHKAKSRGKVYLVGALRLPGPQDLPSDEVLTVSKAILRAGGFTDFADKKNVKVTRKGADGKTDQTFSVNVEVILEKGKSEADLPLLPGDLIYVPERLIRF